MKNRFKRIAFHTFVAIIGACCLEFAGNIAAPGSIAIFSVAEAVVGRPLTPVSVAGVARRCARGVTC
jgi:hypothetical protein